ncbi:MAG TPA: DNA ligase D [Gemmatimonadales bacterium]|nr:DNA ligase D [Gemmatimonadales bacterium]
MTVPARAARRAFIPPQLASLVTEVPGGAGWRHEIKYDGYRLQAHVASGAVRLLTRTGLDWTAKFPAIADGFHSLPVRSAILDGEAVALDAEGRSRFQLLQGALDGTARVPLVYFVFDLLALNGKDLRGESLDARQKMLRGLLGRRRGAVQFSASIAGRGDEILGAACKLGLEGVVSKRRDLPYTSGRGRGWVKTKCGGRQDFLVAGFTPPRGSREHIGSLLLAVRDAGDVLRYAGRVGTGMSAAMLADLHRRLLPLTRATPPVTPTPKGTPAGTIWVDPVVIVEVGFSEWTADGRLRHPALVGIRTDRDPADAGGEEIMTDAGSTLTHPDRVIYTRPTIRKRDVAAYYERIAPLILPHVVGRPVSIVRCPEGMAGECFFQKHWSGKLPPGLGTVSITEKNGTREYLVVNNAAGLVSLVQFGALELHLWSVRADNVEAPDRVVFDLDPGDGVPWSRVRDAARDVRGVLQHLGLESWIKLTGGKGVHVVVPIARRGTWEEVSSFARALAEYMAARDPAQYVSRMAKAERGGKIFIDWLRNTRGATWIAPWSTRARAGGAVSAPLPWTRLAATRAANQVTLVSLMKGRRPADPWAAMLTTRQRLVPAMTKALAARQLKA